MRTLKSALAIAALAALSACAGMDSSDKGAVAGAALGGVAGSAITGGSTLGTVGGAVAGGSAAEFATILAEATEKWAKVIKFAGIKVE